MPDATDSVLIRRLTPKNFLSFGPDNEGIELGPLNLLIGPNGCGKSNLIEAVNLMRAAPKEYRQVFRDSGAGIAEWIWKGQPKLPASIDWVITNPNGRKAPMPLRHVISFLSESQGFSLDQERVEDEKKVSGKRNVDYYYRYNDGDGVGLKINANSLKDLKDLKPGSPKIEPDRSILAQRRDPDVYPEFGWLAENYEKIRIYREWTFGRNAVFRKPQDAAMRNDILDENFSNLGMFLNRLKTRFPVAKREILARLKDLYDGITDFEVTIVGGTVQILLTEGDFAIPAPRLSDGTLRYLCLLAILCDPEPPPLICIEEPELGLHPDILPTIADLLLSASKRTQLIVTTHSDVLVDAMNDTPEVVVVCSKEEGQTKMERLNPDELSVWLKKYRLGQLWIDGQIGGKRW